LENNPVTRLNVEGERKATACHICKAETECVWMKASHVPLYAWICRTCLPQWNDELFG